MAENVDDLVLEQLCLIRKDLRVVRTDLSEFKDEVRSDLSEVDTNLGALRITVFGLASVMGEIDKRVEHVGEKLGIKP